MQTGFHRGATRLACSGTRTRAVLLALAFATPMASAQTEPPATGTDRALLSACLRESLSQPRACIGAIAVPCVRQAAAPARAEAEITCAKREAALWRERLEAASVALGQRLDPGQRSRFAALQRNWEGYAAQKCAFLGELQPAARMAAMQTGCDLREVAERALEVERSLQGRQATTRSQRNQPPRIER